MMALLSLPLSAVLNGATEQWRLDAERERERDRAEFETASDNVFCQVVGHVQEIRPGNQGDEAKLALSARVRHQIQLV